MRGKATRVGPCADLYLERIVRALSILTAIAAVLLLSACSSSTEPDMRWADPATIEYAAELNVNLDEMERRSSGLYVQDLEVGDGEEAAVSSEVRVRYTGWLPNGVEFDSRTQNFQVNSLIDGWREGIPGMREGGTRRLVVPPHLAYGPAAAGAIPPYATLIFEIELIEIL